MLQKSLSTFWSIPPGLLIAVLAFVAFIVTLIPPDRVNRPVRSVGWLLGLLLVAGELSILKHTQRQETSERAEQNLKHEGEVATLLKHFGTIENLLVEENRVSSIRSQPAAELAGLRGRTLDLAGEILRFLVNRQTAPGYGQGGFGEGGYGGTDTNAEPYQEQTVELYLSAFRDRVSAIRDALADRGLRDKELDGEYLHPANAYSVRTIAVRLAALAEKMN